MDRAVGLMLPAKFAGRGVQGVQDAVIRANQHRLAGDDGGRLNLGLGLESPDAAAVACPDGMEDTAAVADEYRAAGDRRRRFRDRVFGLVRPARLAGLEIERDEGAG